MNVSFGEPKKSKFKVLTDGTKTYTSFDFYVRTEGGDVKFRTEDLAMEIACLANRCSGKVIATVVKKITHSTWRRKEKAEKEIMEMPKSTQLFEIYLANGYTTKSGRFI